MKKKVELRKIDLKSLFRAVVITMAIPVIIVLILGLVGGEDISLASVVLVPVLYGLVMMLLGSSYNWLAPRFGGLIVQVVMQDELEPPL